jgi:hypothetical protein
LTDELVRYHKVLDGLAVDSDQSTQLRRSAGAVEEARAGGLPSSEAEEAEEAALPSAGRRLAIDAPTVTQIPSAEATDDSDIVDAELVDQPREELR